MSTGPLVGGIGLLAFARLDEHADHLTGVLPAGLVFGFGLAMTVAPLTATVLEAADRRYAGIASGASAVQNSPPAPLATGPAPSHRVRSRGPWARE